MNRRTSLTSKPLQKKKTHFLKRSVVKTKQPANQPGTVRFHAWGKGEQTRTNALRRRDAGEKGTKIKKRIPKEEEFAARYNQGNMILRYLAGIMG